MVDNAIFRDYLAQIEQACKAGNATEHTYRPVLKSLLETFQHGIIAALARTIELQAAIDEAADEWSLH